MELLLVQSIMKTGNTVRRYVDRQAEKVGVDFSGGQMRIVGYLISQGDREVFQKDIEETFSLARSTVSGLLRHMEQEGLIRREAVKNDARLKRVVATQKAVQQHAWIQELDTRIEAVIGQDFTPEEKALLLEYLDRVRENLRRRNPSGGETPSRLPRAPRCH